MIKTKEMIRIWMCKGCDKEYTPTKGHEKTQKYCSYKCKVSANAKDYREKHNESIRKRDKGYREKNKEAIRKRQKAWREKNKEYKKAYRDKNKEHIKEYNKTWYKKNKKLKRGEKEYDTKNDC